MEEGGGVCEIWIGSVVKDVGIERVAGNPLASTTRIERDELSGRTGVPLRVPVALSRLRPRGRPSGADHLRGASPPVAVKVTAKGS